MFTTNTDYGIQLAKEYRATQIDDANARRFARSAQAGHRAARVSAPKPARRRSLADAITAQMTAGVQLLHLR